MGLEEDLRLNRVSMEVDPKVTLISIL